MFALYGECTDLTSLLRSFIEGVCCQLCNKYKVMNFFLTGTCEKFAVSKECAMVLSKWQKMIQSGDQIISNYGTDCCLGESGISLPSLSCNKDNQSCCCKPVCVKIIFTEERCCLLGYYCILPSVH